MLALNELTSTPYEVVSGTGAGLCAGLCDGPADGLAEGEAGVRDELATTGVGVFEAVVPGRLQAPATIRTAAPSARRLRDGGIIKGNDTLRFGLRFRYDPEPEAGHRPSPPELRSKGSRLWRTASGCPFCFI